MKYLFTLLSLFLLVCPIQAQKKKTYYQNEKGDIITKTEYESKRRLLSVKYDLDTAIVYRLEKREDTGKLNQEVYQRIKNNLIANSNNLLKDGDCIIIHYYPGKDPCNSAIETEGKDERNAIHLSNLREIGGNVPFFVYKNNKGLSSQGKAYDWLPDTDQLLEKLFFNNHYACGSFIILSPHKEYFLYKGEYNHEYLYRKLIYIQGLVEMGKSIISEADKPFHTGNITPDIRTQILNDLTAQTNQTLHADEIVLIEYYFGFNRCTLYETKDVRNANNVEFLKKLKLVNGVTPFFVYESKANIETQGDKVQWIEDIKKRIKVNFFHFSYMCNSYLIILPTGEYVMIPGENDRDKIIEVLKNIKEKLVK